MSDTLDTKPALRRALEELDDYLQTVRNTLRTIVTRDINRFPVQLMRYELELALTKFELAVEREKNISSRLSRLEKGKLPQEIEDSLRDDPE